MKTIFALLALVGYALAEPSYSQPIAKCDWSFTVIDRPNHTETLAIPAASPSCSLSSFVVTAPLSASAPPPSVAPIGTAGTGTGYPPIASSYTGPVINAGAMPTAAPILVGGALGVLAMI